MAQYNKRAVNQFNKNKKLFGRANPTPRSKS